VNFVGHAHVALRLRDDAAFVLGAMLPDFASMARVRIASTTHEGLRAGIAFHHQVDDAFHGSPTFVALAARAGDRLEREGVGRGPARAAAHVGIELVLDGLLVRDPETRSAYRTAVASAGPTELGRHLTFPRDEHRERYEDFVGRLVRWGVPDGYNDPEIVLTRLVQTLSRRPRLALAPNELPSVAAWMSDVRAVLETRKDDLFEELYASLARAR
jgi:hypothetical protein